MYSEVVQWLQYLLQLQSLISSEFSFYECKCNPNKHGVDFVNK